MKPYRDITFEFMQGGYEVSIITGKLSFKTACASAAEMFNLLRFSYDSADKGADVCFFITNKYTYMYIYMLF